MPDTFPVWDFGAQFAAQKAAYENILVLQEQMHATAREVHGTLFRTRESVAQAFASPEITEAQRADLEKLIADAEALEASAAAKVLNVDVMRLTMLRDVVDEIGTTLQKLKAWRSEIILGEKGLETGFDPLLAGVVARYKAVYRPEFPLTKLPGAIAQVPDPSGWGDQEWDHIDRALDGPIFMWSPKECEENWHVPGVPDCDGPDYFTALTMINMIFVAKQNQIDIMDEFPIIAAFDVALLGGALEEYEGAVKVAQEALDALWGVLKDLGKTAAAIIEGVRKAAETFAKAPILLIAGAAAIMLLLNRKK